MPKRVHVATYVVAKRAAAATGQRRDRAWPTITGRDPGSIIAAIITVHMPTKEPKAASPDVSVIWSPMGSPRFPVEVCGERVELSVPVAGERGEELLRERHRGGLQPVADPPPFTGLG